MLYILTPIFCVALLCGAVFSFSKTDNKVTASAAEATKLESKYVQTFAGQSDMGMSNGGRTYSSFNISASASCGSCALSENVITVTKTANRNNVAAYISFKAELVLPAYTKVKVVYSYQQNLDRTSDGTSEDAQASNFVYYFGDSESGGSDKSVNEPFPCSTTGQADTVVSSPYCLSSLRTRYVEPKNYSGVIPEITYSNATGSDKTCTAYFGFYVVTQYSGMQNVGGTHTLTLSENITTETVNVQPDKNSDIYSADGNIFTFNYNKYQIKLSAINFTDTAGDSSSIYDGTGESPVKANGECKLTGAGTYSFDFDIIGEAKWIDTNDKRTKQVTLTIDKAKPNVLAEFGDTLPDPLYTSYNGGKLPKLINNADNATDGKIEWQTGQSPSASNSKYYWQFTPTDTLNYNNITGRTEETQLILAYQSQSIKNLEVTLRKVKDDDGEDTAEDVTIYDAFTLGDGDFSLKKYITVKAVYQDGKTKVTLSDSDYDLELDDGSENLSVGSVTLVAIKSDDGKSGTLSINVLESEVKDLLVTYKDNGTHLKYSDTLTADNIKANLTVRAKWNYSGDDYVEVTDKSKYSISGDIKAGSPITLTVSYGGKTKDFKPTIDKGTLTPTVTFDDLTVTYDGNDKKIEATVSGLPEGFTLTPVYTVTGQGTATEFTNAGTYNYTVSFTHTNPNYEQYTATKTATLEIEKADYPNAGDIKFEGATVTHDGNSHKLEATDVPTGVTVTYVYDGTEQSTPFEFTEIKESGYTVTAKFAHTNPNYKDIAEKTATLYISAKPVYNITATFENDEIEYDGNSHTLVIDGDLPDGVTVEYYIGEEKFTGATIVGDYEITAKFTGSDDYAPIPDKTATLKITKADYDMSGVTFGDSTVIYDGEKHELKIGGVELPDWITVTYEYTGDLTAAGTYEITAKFTHENPNYKTIADKKAKLTINDAVVTEIKAELEVKEYTTANTLDDLKAKLKVTAVYSNGTTAEIEDYELTCNGLSDSGMLKAGNQSVTVAYDEFTAVINNVIVSRQKVALPVFKGGLKYTGVSLKPTVENFNGYDADVMTFVVDKTVPGLTVGSYKAVFALNDSENYEWATAKTLKKNVFAAVVYDGEVTLLANEAAVDWNISKAVLTATKADGGLPVFASESFIGAFADVVTLRYYKDEACTEEVPAEELAKETQYYVKAELLDTENFELDASAAQYTVKSFSYTTPAKELTVWDKVVRFLKANWLWIVIAAVALILLILIIALAARSAKKKREREERRLAEEKAERERREEREEQRRREDREERMARLSQQQAAPAPQYIPQYAPQPQYMPQSMPQNGQSAPMGGGSMDGTQFALIQAELAAIKAEQSAARELAAIRAEQSAARELAELKAQQAAKEQAEKSRLEAQVANMETRMGGEQASGIVGISLDKLTELVERTVERVLEGKEKPAAAAAESNAAPVTAQVPPDAVMTTVTTTKIDTTKKTAQSEPQAAPVRTVVRNVVAPMPVDDGRVFDVGGFYKPADPVTDMEFGEDEKKDL